MNFLDLIDQRSSYDAYDENETIADSVIKSLAQQAFQAPTAYHMQNVKLIAVTSTTQKDKLYSVSYRQDKVKKAPLTFIICGDMDAYLNLGNALQPSLASAQISVDMVEDWVAAVTHSHRNDAQLQRDEAIRSAALCSMLLMLAAENMGYATGPMSGFEPIQLQQAFELPQTLLPVMLVTIGTPTTPRYSQKVRLPLASQLSIV